MALLDRHDYLADRRLATSVFLALRMGRPLFLEGEAGVGKTEIAKVLATALGKRLVRLQCYEGLDVASAVYEWNYPRQMIEIRLAESAGQHDREALAHDIFTPRFLLKRPILEALAPEDGVPPVLLIDELDRADEPFEAYLLEVLADFQVTIPELGPIVAAAPPIVVITSNRTREIHDAIKRRCLYHWLGYPDAERELAIVRRKCPGVPEALAREIVAFTQRVRALDLFKAPGIAETLDWAEALTLLDRVALDPQAIADTAGVLLKYQDDIGALGPEVVAKLLAEARAAGQRVTERPHAGTMPPAGIVAAAPSGRVAENIVHFVRVLRAAGLPVGTAHTLAAQEAAVAVGIAEREDFRAALAAVLVSRYEHLPVFEQAFDLFWQDPRLLQRVLASFAPAGEVAGERDPEQEIAARIAQAMLPAPSLPERKAAGGTDHEPAFTFSPREVLQHRDFETMTADELAAVKTMLGELRLPLPELPTRRTVAAARGHRVDLRATLRRATGAAGALSPLRWRRRGRRTPPLVILCDISGSMDRYARMLLHFLHAITGDHDRVHVLLFGTRLTNITRHLRHRDVDVALARVPVGGAGLGRRHAHRRLPRRIQPAVVAAAPRPECRRAPDQRRPGRRGGRRARRADGAAAQVLPATRVAQSAAALRRLRAAPGRHPGHAPPCRRIPAGA